MQYPLPLNRRARTWYGQRSEPSAPLRHAEPPPEKRVCIPALRIAQIGLQIRNAPVDRRLTALL